jgi:hypothetical protein
VLIYTGSVTRVTREGNRRRCPDAESRAVGPAFTREAEALPGVAEGARDDLVGLSLFDARCGRRLGGGTDGVGELGLDLFAGGFAHRLTAAEGLLAFLLFAAAAAGEDFAVVLCHRGLLLRLGASKSWTIRRDDAEV